MAALSLGTTFAVVGSAGAYVPTDESAGQTSRNASVPLTNDTLQESSETINLTLSAPTNAALGAPNPATLTIIDDETPPPMGEQRLCR